MSIEELGTAPADDRTDEPNAGAEPPPVDPAHAFVGTELAGPAPEPEAKPVAAAEPVEAAERVGAVDVMRGVALLGILAMNIVGFAWPEPAYSNPVSGAGFAGTDRLVYIVNHIVFDTKMMTTFSMLFGAGLVLMGDRADRRGRSLLGVYYRRCFWLIVIGAIHAYLIWDGDILVLYGECGLLLYPLRHARPKILIAVGLAATLLVVPLAMGFGAAIDFMKAAAARAEAAKAAGKTPTKLDEAMQKAWKQAQPQLRPDPIQRARNWNEDLVVHSGGYAGIVRKRASHLLVEHTIGFVLGGLWLAGGRMLLGMGLMKLGVFSATRSRRFYLGLMALGYGLGLPMVVYDTYALISRNFERVFDYIVHGGVIWNYAGGVLVALGHVGLVMLAVREGWLSGLARRLAAAGRMALSNYLFDSILCTTIFYGYGLNLFGTIHRTGLAGIVLAIWAFQLSVSPLWLAHFRYGPAEWAWRSLTYGKLQPMRREEKLAGGAVPALA